MKNPFAQLNTLLKTEKEPERRLIRHPREREIIEIALNNLKDSPKAQELVAYMEYRGIKAGVLRGRIGREYAPNKEKFFISVADDVDIHDPKITIDFVGALARSVQEYNPHLCTIDPARGETLYVHREEQKFHDMLTWQTAFVYELGKMVNKDEFIDSFTIMGYSSLIDAYEKDLKISQAD